MKSYEQIEGGAAILLLADHAGSDVPDGIDLGISDEERLLHIGVDIGIAALTRRVAKALGAPAHLSRFSRLVFDPNRDADSAGLAPEESDGICIAGNVSLTAEQRRVRRALHEEYHGALTARIEMAAPEMLVSIHSFTPVLASAPEAAPRPWDTAFLYNEDAATARIGIDFMTSEGLRVGDNEPYSGALTGYTVIRHAESRGIPSLFIEIRNDHLRGDSGVDQWSSRVARLIRHTQKVLNEQKGDPFDGR
ncbi:N-formylglutamate amidohydrolase [Pacificimonas sp. WHA3]|uniref:N-formylglutamate amidohydrolase n=1 Tax=Pacificimonas pallii TaxID=2827236 RepID=A0ABS6SDY3_9SPHN|nr:N-formylglutamate amidohydrolase [Pacificimonas pallii]MBV7256566.1 N-formylglutamate amidohydrolase [Pacificimonas pallii]